MTTHPAALAAIRAPAYRHLGSYRALLAECAQLDAAYAANEDRAYLEAIASHIGIDAEDGFGVRHLALLMVSRDTFDGLNMIQNYSLSTDPLHEATYDAEIYLDNAAGEMLDELREAVRQGVALQVAA